MESYKDRIRRALRVADPNAAAVWESASELPSSTWESDLGRSIQQSRQPASRARKGKAGTDAKESEIQAGCLSLLSKHPNVAWVARFNSGGFANAEGKHVYQMIRIKADLAFPDIAGMLKDGRFFAMECKRASWKGVARNKGGSETREERQERFLELVRTFGGVAGFVKSIDECLMLIEDR